MSSRSSRTDLPERVAVGRVLRPHGVRGEVVVEVLSDVPGRLDAGSVLLASREGAAGTDERREPPRPLTISEGYPHKSGARVRFREVADRDGAEALRGTLLEVERARVPPAPPGTYYHYELLGCRCSDGGREP